MKRRPGGGRLEGAGAHQLIPSNSAILSPGSERHDRLLVARAVALDARAAGAAATREFMIRTSVTRTPQISSTAWRTCVLCARVGDPERVVVLLHLGGGLLRPDRRQDHVAGLFVVEAISSRPPRWRAPPRPRPPPARRPHRHGLALAEHPVDAVERGLRRRAASGPRGSASTPSSSTVSDDGLRQVAERVGRRVLGLVDDDHERAIRRATSRSARARPSCAARRSAPSKTAERVGRGVQGERHRGAPSGTPSGSP